MACIHRVSSVPGYALYSRMLLPPNRKIRPGARPPTMFFWGLQVDLSKSRVSASCPTFAVNPSFRAKNFRLMLALSNTLLWFSIMQDRHQASEGIADNRRAQGMSIKAATIWRNFLALIYVTLVPLWIVPLYGSVFMAAGIANSTSKRGENRLCCDITSLAEPLTGAWSQDIVLPLPEASVCCGSIVWLNTAS